MYHLRLTNMIGVIGYSGAGKSTLVRLVNQLRQYQMVKLLLMVMRLIHIKKKIYVILKRYRYDLSTFQFA